MKPLDFHPLNALISIDFMSVLLPVPVGRFLLLSLPMEVPPNLTTICLLLELVLVAMVLRFMLLRRSVKKVWVYWLLRSYVNPDRCYSIISMVHSIGKGLQM